MQVSSPEMEAGEATDKRDKNENSPVLVMGLVTAGGREKLCVPSDANGNDLEVRILENGQLYIQGDTSGR